MVLAAGACAMTDPAVARLKDEWYEEIGPVLWWKFPVDEPPYVGSPLDLGHAVEVRTQAGLASRFTVGGWPGYHTHWTPLPTPPTPLAKLNRSFRLEAVKRDKGIREEWGDRLVMIWSAEHRAWWGQKFAGYTTQRPDAGIYAFEDAYQATKHCDPSKKIIFQVLT